MHTSVPSRGRRPSSAQRRGGCRPPAVLAPAAMKAARLAPRTARATHRGALGQVVATKSVVQVEAHHVAGGQGEVLSHGCAGNTGGRLCAGGCEERAGGTLRDGTGRTLQGKAGRGGAGLRLRPRGGAAASSTSRASERRRGHGSRPLRVQPSPRPAPPLCSLCPAADSRMPAPALGFP